MYRGRMLDERKLCGSAMLFTDLSREVDRGVREGRLLGTCIVAPLVTQFVVRDAILWVTAARLTAHSLLQMTEASRALPHSESSF